VGLQGVLGCAWSNTPILLQEDYMLKCNACFLVLPETHFHKCSTITRGYQYKCKACVSRYDKNPTDKQRETKLTRVKEWAAENPDKRREQKIRHYHKHKERIDQKAKDWYNNNKDRYYANSLKRKYGISLEEYNSLREQQGHRCAICSEHEDQIGKKMFVDHNHATGEIRQLLCTRCNVGIGMFKDSAHLLNLAASYLTKHG
jgi:hypothetical protein